MWGLVIILLLPIPGVHRVTVLEKFSSIQACQDKRARVGFDMAHAYPYDRDFVIECRLLAV